MRNVCFSFPLFFFLGAALQRINQRFFILDLETEAGTYVKEFVHGVYVCMCVHFTPPPTSVGYVCTVCARVCVYTFFPSDFL
jgi:hypothetical protein